MGFAIVFYFVVVVVVVVVFLVIQKVLNWFCIFSCINFSYICKFSTLYLSNFISIWQSLKR